MLKKNYFQNQPKENATLLLRSQLLLILFVVTVVERGIQFILHISTRNKKLYFAFFGSTKQKRSESGQES